MPRYSDMWEKVKGTLQAGESKFENSLATLKNHVEYVKELQDGINGWRQGDKLTHQQKECKKALDTLTKLYHDFMQDVDQVKEIRSELQAARSAQKRKETRKVKGVLSTFVDAGCPEGLASLFTDFLGSREGLHCACRRKRPASVQ